MPDIGMAIARAKVYNQALFLVSLTNESGGI